MIIMRVSSIKKITIVTKPNITKDILEVSKKIKYWCDTNERELTIVNPHKESFDFKNFAKTIKLQAIERSDLFSYPDLIISLGGDGTLIGISRLSPTLSPPIIGVNMGRVGFITEFTKEEFLQLITDNFKGLTHYKLPLFKALVIREGKTIFKDYFINDTVLHKNDISRMFSLSIGTKEQHIYNISGDGLIISTPLGSTAYSLAAGGPLIYPEVKALALTPICPHSLTHRPFVMPEDHEMHIKLLEDPQFVSLTLDGQEHIELKGSDLIVIKKNRIKNIRFIRNKNKSYFRNLSNIFTYGKRIKTYDS